MRVPTDYHFFCPVKIGAGSKALEHLPVDLGGPPAGVPLIVADAGWRAKKVAGAFRDSGMSVAVCDSVSSKPDAEVIRKLAAIYRERRCSALVAAGGGALVDAAKLVNVLVSSGEDDLERFAGENGIPVPLRPLAVVPVPGGNGLEVSRYASVGDLVFSSPHLLPAIAVIDPRLMRAETIEGAVHLGLAALAHAIEAWCGPSKNPVTDAWVYSAVRLIGENLVPAAGGDAGRERLCALVTGAVLAGCAFSNAGPGMLHLLSEAAADEWDLPLGWVLGALLPYAMEYRALSGNRHGAGLLLALAGPDVYSQTAEGLRGAIAVNIVHALLYDLNKASRGLIPLNLTEAGVGADSFRAVARRAAEAGPGLCSERAALLILEHAASGYPIGSL